MPFKVIHIYLVVILYISNSKVLMNTAYITNPHASLVKYWKEATFKKNVNFTIFEAILQNLSLKG
jgi:hypothetical protein